PWYGKPVEGAAAEGPFGRILDQQAFYERLAEADDFKLVHLDAHSHGPEGSLALWEGHHKVGWVEAGYPGDDSQTAQLMLENLACKVTAVEAARHCLKGFDPLAI